MLGSACVCVCVRRSLQIKTTIKHFLRMLNECEAVGSISYGRLASATKYYQPRQFIQFFMFLYFDYTHYMWHRITNWLFCGIVRYSRAFCICVCSSTHWNFICEAFPVRCVVLHINSIYDSLTKLKMYDQLPANT